MIILDLIYDKTPRYIAILMCWVTLVFQGQAQRPKEESSVAESDLSLNKVNLVHRYFPSLTGAGYVVSIKENKFDSTDIDLLNRSVFSAYPSSVIAAHATDMATIIGGAGNTSPLLVGVAPAVRFSSASFYSQVPEPDAYYRQQAILVQNHSFGIDPFQRYTTRTIAYDAAAKRLNDVLFVFSAGNSGEQNCLEGKYKGLPAVGNLTGDFKMAKNILVVGGLDSLGVLEGRSSRGPAFDGRIKPELVAFGHDGSSGASALVSGIATLLQQQYALQRNGKNPSSALVKALLLNSADDVGEVGIDHQSGFGSVNAYEAVNTLNSGRFFSGEITNGSSQTFRLAIPSNVKKLKITLCWNDTPAKENSSKALVNDLDMSLLTPENQQVLPWVLSTFPHADSLRKLPVRKQDHLNNIEQITLDSPVAGQYAVIVSGYTVTDGTQPFSVAYQWEIADEFQWEYPTNKDYLLVQKSELLRWKSTKAAGLGVLEYSLDKGATWKKGASVDLTKQETRWLVPNLVNTQARLRMTIDGKTYVSDTFLLVKNFEPTLSYNCQDSLMLSWDALDNTRSYQVSVLQGETFVPLKQTQETTIVIDKKKVSSSYFAITPIAPDGTRGLRSKAYNLTGQVVNCFLKGFTADVIDGQVLLNLSLSELALLKQISFQRLEGEEFSDLYSFIPQTAFFNYFYIDPAPRQGANTYRAKVMFNNNAIAYTSPERVYFFGNAPVWVFPNPVSPEDAVYIKAQNPTDCVWKLYDASGRLVVELPLVTGDEFIPAPLTRGTYIYRLFKNGQALGAGKLLVR